MFSVLTTSLAETPDCWNLYFQQNEDIFFPDNIFLDKLLINIIKYLIYSK